MRRILLSLALLCAFGTLTAGAAGSAWEDEYEKALAEAAKEGKFVLLDFTGSDWCGWCIRLDNEVFSKTAFKKFARENLVLMVVDTPRTKRLAKKTETQNRELKRRFGIQGFPTVVLVLPDGTEVARTGYQEGGADKYVEHLETLLAPHREKLPAPGKPTADATAGGKKKPAATTPPATRPPARPPRPDEVPTADEVKQAIENAL